MFQVDVRGGAPERLLCVCKQCLAHVLGLFGAVQAASALGTKTEGSGRGDWGRGVSRWELGIPFQCMLQHHVSFKRIAL